MVKVRQDRPLNEDGEIDLHSWVEQVIQLAEISDPTAAEILLKACKRASAVENLPGDELTGWGTGYSSFTAGLEMAEIFTEVLGKKVKYNAVPPEVYRSFGFPGAEDLGNMYQFKTQFESVFRKARNVDESRKLNPELQTFEAWLRKNHAKIPVHKETV